MTENTIFGPIDAMSPEMRVALCENFTIFVMLCRRCSDISESVFALSSTENVEVFRIEG